MRNPKLRSTYSSLDDLSRAVSTRVNNEPTFNLTLNSSTSVTTVSNEMAGTSSVIDMTPLTAGAASEPWWISSRGSGTFDITHSSGSSTRSFVYTIFG